MDLTNYLFGPSDPSEGSRQQEEEPDNYVQVPVEPIRHNIKEEFNPGLSLVDLLISELGLKNNRELMSLNMRSEKGIKARIVINSYLLQTGGEYKLMTDASYLMLMKKNDGWTDIFRMPMGPEIKSMEERAAGSQYRVTETEEGEIKRIMPVHSKGTESKPRHLKFSDVWARLCNVPGLDLTARIR